MGQSYFFCRLTRSASKSRAATTTCKSAPACSGAVPARRASAAGNRVNLLERYDYTVEPREIDVASIHHVERTGFEGQHVQHVYVAQLAIADVDESGDRTAQVQQRVQLDGCLGGSKRRPVEQAQTQIDGAGVQRIDGVVQLDPERVARIELARATNQQRGEVRPDAPVARFVGVGQRGALDRRAKPIAYSLLALADRLASMSRKLSRQVSCAKAIARNCSAHDRVRTPESPPCRWTIRVKLAPMRRARRCLPNCRGRCSVRSATSCRRARPAAAHCRSSGCAPRG